MAAIPTPVPVSASWARLRRRQVAELTLPGVAIGLVGGAIAGGMAASGGLSPLVTAVVAIALAVPLALGGAGYELLLAKGKMPVGPLAPAAAYWFIAFPVARIVHAAVVSWAAGDAVAVPHGWLDFIVYQMLLSIPFAIGFWWLHENFAPRWWFHVRQRNPVADHFVRVDLQFADVAEAEKERRRVSKQAKSRRRERGL